MPASHMLAAERTKPVCHNMCHNRGALDSARLLRDVEGVDAAARHAGGGNPVAPVGAHIIVQQARLEPVGALPPVLLQIQCQVAGHVLPPPVGHPAWDDNEMQDQCGSECWVPSQLAPGSWPRSAGPGWDIQLA